MLLIPTLFLLWPFALIGLTLLGSHLLRARPEHQEDLWLLPWSSRLQMHALPQVRPPRLN